MDGDSGDNSESYPLRRPHVVSALLRGRGDLLVVAGLGGPAYDVLAEGDHDLNFTLWGGMGAAALMGLGLALAQPNRRVLVITGDGEMLMGLGGLSTIAAKGPENLGIAVLDNERYGETGMQRTHTAGPTDLAAVARAAGFPVAQTVRGDNEFEAALPLIRDGKGPGFFAIKVKAEPPDQIPKPQDGVELKNRFRQALLG